MTAPEKRASRALCIGRSAETLASVIAELAALGHKVEGSTEPETAAQKFEPGALDLVFVGRGVSGAARDRLRRQFAARHPGAAVYDAPAAEAVRLIADVLEGRAAAFDLDAYCARIGYDGPLALTLETLGALQKKHQAAIPFEAIDVVLGGVTDISPQAIDAKLIAARRGGFCYEQNGLFMRALAALGFEVDGLMARVLMGRPPGAPAPGRTHMTLRVTVEDVPYLADVGFGGMVPPEPLRLDVAGPQETAHEPWRLAPSGPLTRALAFTGEGWDAMYEFSGEAQTQTDYEIANWFTCTHPSSFFRRELVAARVTPKARFALFGRRLSERRPGEQPARRELDATGLEQALTEVFGLEVQPEWRPLLERTAAEEG